MNMSETPYGRFLRTFFDVSHRDGPNMRVLDALSPLERERAEQELIDHLPRVDVIQGLAHLGSAKAIEPLRNLLNGDRWIAIHAASALWDIASDREALRVLCRSVEDRPWIRRRGERLYAAAKLRYGVDNRDAVATLINAINDRDTTVRAHAQLGVAERLRLNAEADALGSNQMTIDEFRVLAREALDREYPTLGYRPGSW